MSMIEDIRKDRKANTDGFHWIGETLMAKEFGEVIELCNVDWSGIDEFEAEHKRRIARLADVEAALLAAEELADAVDEWGAKGRTEVTAAALNTALGNYRAATGGAA